MAGYVNFSRFFEAYKSAVFAKNVDALNALYAKDVIAFDMWGDWSVVGEGPWRDMNRAWLTSLGEETVVVDFDDISTFPGADVAAATATISFKAVSPKGETLRSMQNRLTWVAKPIDGVWKIVHQHTSIPIDPATTKPKFHR
jgi:ketosteroid isomerase-like protein